MHMQKFLKFIEDWKCYLLLKWKLEKKYFFLSSGKSSKTSLEYKKVKKLAQKLSNIIVSISFCGGVIWMIVSIPQFYIWFIYFPWDVWFHSLFDQELRIGKKYWVMVFVVIIFFSILSSWSAITFSPFSLPFFDTS